MIIAEIGLNHLGDEEYLAEYISNLIHSPVDAITVQIRESEFYDNTEYSNLFLDLGIYDGISKTIKKSNKKFGVALADVRYVTFFDEIVDFYKILSKDLGNNKFINEFVNLTDKPIYISTGLSSYDEIEAFVAKIDDSKKKNVTLIHTRLSNKVEHTNLKAIKRMKDFFDYPIAFGNHCENHNVTYAALSFEPSSIFLYVKGNRDSKHPDDKHAVRLEKISQFCKNINEIKDAIGSGTKTNTKNTIRGQK